MLCCEMQKQTLSSFLDTLDLTDPQDLLIAFHAAKHWPATKHITEASFMRDLPIIEALAPLIFGQPDNADTVADVRALLW